MGDKPVWEQIDSSFIQHYYQFFDNDRSQLGAVYFDVSCFTWEGQQFQGKAAIVEILPSFHSRKPSTASQLRTISPGQIVASSAQLWASSRPMKTPSCSSTRCSYQRASRLLGFVPMTCSGLPCTTWAEPSQPGIHAISSFFLLHLLFNYPHSSRCS